MEIADERVTIDVLNALTRSDAMTAAFHEFRQANPGFDSTTALDDLRARDYARLDEGSTSISTTPAAASTPTRSSRAHMELLRENVFGNPHSINPTSSATTSLVERARERRARRTSTPRPTSTSRSSRRTRPARCGSSASRTRSARATASCSRSTTTTRSTGSASSRAREARRRATCRASRPTCASTRSVLRKYLGRDARLGTTISSRTRRSRTSPACSIRSSGSTRRRRTAGTCSSTAPRSCRRTGSTSSAGTRTSWRCRSTSCSATRRASAACSRARRRWRSSSGRGSPAARSSRVRCSGTGTGRPRASPPSRTARSTTSTSRRSRSGCEHIERIGIDTIHERVSCLGAWLLEQLQRAPPQRRRGRRPRSTDRERGTGRGATIAFNFLHPSGRWIDERFVDRIAERAQRLGADGLLLQPGLGRARVLDQQGHADRRRVRRRADPRRVHPRDRSPVRGRRARCRSASRRTSRTSTASSSSRARSSTSPRRTCPTTCRRASPAERHHRLVR